MKYRSMVCCVVGQWLEAKIKHGAVALALKPSTSLFMAGGEKKNTRRLGRSIILVGAFPSPVGHLHLHLYRHLCLFC